METSKTCFYCLNQYIERDNEHVFPEGLGGQRTMMDCVCGDCNKLFSPFENELISKSFIAFMRVAETPSGDSANKGVVMTEARSLRIDSDLKVALEVLVQSQLREKLVAQIVLKDNLLHIRYEDQPDFDKLLTSILDWKLNNLTFTQKVNGDIVCWLATKDQQHQTVVIDPIQDAKKGFIGLIIIKDDDKANEFLFPRIFRDSQGRLKIRARSQAEAFELIRHLVWWDGKTRPVIETVVEGVHEISVLHSHNGVMFNRALVKIAINSLLACYPSAKQERQKLLSAVTFVLENAGEVPFVVTHAKNDLDHVEKTHNLFFYNYNSETRIRISLYNGAFQIVFLLPRLTALDEAGSGRLLIDYVNKKNTFQDLRTLNADLEAAEKGYRFT